MNKNSYTFLIPVVIGVQLALALVLIWQFGIWPTIHFNAVAQKTCLIGSLVLTVIGAVLPWRFKRPQFMQKTNLDRIKVVLGLFVMSAMLMVLVLAVTIYVSSVVPSTYVAAYEYSPHGRKSCQGIHVVDPDLNRQIKICTTSGLLGGGLARVEKRSGPLGIVVMSVVIL